MADALVDRLRAAGCVFAEDEAALLRGSATSAEDLELRVARRVAGEPLEHVTGWAQFCGLRIEVDPGVFVPRPRSEALAHVAIALVERATATRPVLLDLCCGTGAIGRAVAQLAGREVELHASDLDEHAVACARRNLAPVGGIVAAGDLYAAVSVLARGRVDVLVANVPYVRATDIATLPAHSRDHEPRMALDGGSDGLDLLRRVARDAPAWLAPGGHLVSEVTAAQAPAASEAFAEAGLATHVHHDDELDATVVIGHRTR